MRKIFLIFYILIFVNHLKAQITLSSYHALNTTVYNAVDGSMEFSPTYTSGTPTNNQYLSISASSNFEFTGDAKTDVIFWKVGEILPKGIYRAEFFIDGNRVGSFSFKFLLISNFLS
jgi:hypothetical protein